VEVRDSRRLTGANLLWERPGAVIDVEMEDARRPALIEAWSEEVRLRLDAVGWGSEGLRVRSFEGGASLAISAPLDALYAATEVNESAWRAAVARLDGEEPEELDVEVARLRAEIEEEGNPALLALRAAALERGLPFLSDDDHVSVGLGVGSRTWPARELPEPVEVDWGELASVPTAMITGTNGKTTTVRLLSAIVEAAGLVPGVTSTDRLRVGGDVLEAGDWSGPGGARRVLRDRRTQIGLLETARGGMMRRGLALERCDVSAVLNVGADHLGEWGVGTLEGLAEGKFIVTRVAGTVVLNADDEVVAARGRELDQEVVWFSLEPEGALIREHLAAGGRAALLKEGRLELRRGAEVRELLAADQIPCALGGAALYNVANALAAAAIAERLGIDLDAIRAGLAAFESTPERNPGRLNRFERGGVQVLVDFAHNPHGMQALLEMAARLPAERRLVLLGQAGDRDDDSVREMVRVTWAARPDMIVVKELTEHMRGREPGEMPALIEAELRAEGCPPERFVHCTSELDAVRWALEWGRPGDLLLLLVHDVRDEVLRLLEAPDG